VGGVGGGGGLNGWSGVGCERLVGGHASEKRCGGEDVENRNCP